MASPYVFIPEEIKRQATEEPNAKTGKDPSSPGRGASSGPDNSATAQDTPPAGSGSGKKPGKEKKPRKSIFRRTRAGVHLTREEVKEIKLGRKKLRKEMKQKKIYTKREFEMTAASLGLYFDKRGLGILPWLFHGKGLLALLATLLFLIFSLVILAYVSQLRGHFTINMSEDMFRAGFVMSETADFANPTTHLFSDPAVDIPCVSITDIPENVDQVDGSHNEDYFAYTFYLWNEGDKAVDYDWRIDLNSESKSLSVASWLMVFEDGRLSIFAKTSASGGEEMLPKAGNNSRGYPNPFFRDLLSDPDQLQLIRTVGGVSYYRVIPHTFENAYTVVKGGQTEVQPEEVHKYTVVMWLEGDDPECTDELIGGHLGVEMDIRLRGEREEQKSSWLDKFWGNLIWWGR